MARLRAWTLESGRCRTVKSKLPVSPARSGTTIVSRAAVASEAVRCISERAAFLLVSFSTIGLGVNFFERHYATRSHSTKAADLSCMTSRQQNAEASGPRKRNETARLGTELFRDALIRSNSDRTPGFHSLPMRPVHWVSTTLSSRA